MSAPLVSVVVPTRNRARLLADTVTTVLAQTFLDREILVSDNHSSDATWSWLQGEILREQGLTAMRPPQFLDMTAHWNYAVRQTRGQYVALLSDDDLWEPTFLQSVANIVRQYPDADIVGTNFWFLHPDGQRTLRGTRSGRRSGRIRHPLRAILSENLVHLSCALFRRSVFEELGGFGRDWVGDFELWMMAAARRKVFYYLAEPLASYRIHAGMATESLRIQRLMAELLERKRLGSWAADLLRRFACGSAYARLAWKHCQAGQQDEVGRCLRAGFRAFPFHPRILAALGARYPCNRHR